MGTITKIQSKSILTPQTGGFLNAGPYPYTHTLSAYTGCGFGNTACGEYCYADKQPSWVHTGKAEGHAWGDHVFIKENAAELLGDKLQWMTKTKARPQLRIFMSSITDPYQPLEGEYKITQQILQVLTHFDDLGLVVVQTRSPLAARDIDLMKQIPYLWLSVTIETDEQEVLTALKPGGPSVYARFKLVKEAAAAGILTQIAVSPCLPHSPQFAERLALSGANRVIVDTLVAGDGARGARTAVSPIASKVDWNWRDEKPAIALYHALRDKMDDHHTGWSSPGFCGIPSYSIPLKQMTLL